MSRAGRNATAVVASEPAAAPEVPPEILERVERHARAERLYTACKFAIIARYPPLWPPEYVGAAIAEQWMRALQQRYAEMAAMQQRARSQAAGLVLPA